MSGSIGVLRRVSAALAVSGSVLGGGATAAAQSLDEIVAKNLAARGGIERLRALQTVQTSGTLTLEPIGAIPVTTWAKRPNKFRRDSTLPNRQTSTAFDGTTIWVVDSAGGSPTARAITEPEAVAAARQEGNFDPVLLDYKERGHQVTFVGNEEIEGVPVHHLRVTRKGGQVEHYYLNAETGLERRIVGVAERAGFKTEVRTDLSDYREVDGMMFAFRIQQSSGSEKATVTLDRVAFNVPIDDGMFTLGK